MFTFSCKNNDALMPIPPNEDELLGGKSATVFDQTENALGNPIHNLTDADLIRFSAGNSLNRNNWTTAPASANGRDGLGPLFNGQSCSACHLKDGKSNPFTSETNPSQALLFRLSSPFSGLHNEPVDDPNYGGQFNHKAIVSQKAEGNVNIIFQEKTFQYPDGNSYTLRTPTYQFTNLNYGEMKNTLFSPRIAPPMTGLGLLESIDEQTLDNFTDENDTNNDGISGKRNIVWDDVLQKKVKGRFGWKANQPNIKQQTASAFNGDIGITSSVFSIENYGLNQKAFFENIPNGGNPEITDEQLENVIFYIKSLAVPAQRNPKNATILEGKKLFTTINCNGCHVTEIKTGNTATPTQLANQTIRPYSDLLIHDMGDDLADNRPDFEANGKEWRTPPLWGIGLQKTVNKHTFMLHDGRARNIEEAILWHGGEAEKSKDKFKNLTKANREKLLQFIESL